MKRREFLETGLAAGALTLLSGCNGNTKPDQGGGGGGERQPASGKFTLRMHFTGLIMSEIWNQPKKMLVSFVDAIKTHAHEPHVALMLLKITDPKTLVWPEEYPKAREGEDDGRPLHSPQIVRIGSEVYGLWGLDDRAVWIKTSDTSTFDDDEQSSFIFPASAGEWKGLDQFVNMADVLRCPVPPIDDAAVKSQIVITRGTATGLEPLTPCERVREYAIARGPRKEWTYRKYAAEFSVAQEIKGDEVTLGFQMRIGGGARLPKHAVVRLRGSAGSTVELSFMNVPTTNFALASHFPSYSRALGIVKDPLDLDSKDTDECKAQTSEFIAPLDVLRKRLGDLARPKASDNPQPNPPNAGCVPVFIGRD